MLPGRDGRIHVTEGTGLGVTLAEVQPYTILCPLGRFDDRDRARSPEIMPLAQHTLRIQLIVFGIELERYIAFFLVGHHQIQVLAPRAAHERGLARIESQNVHTHAALWMRNRAA